MALAKDDPNKTKLWQLNFRRKAKGLAPFASLEAAIKDGSYVPRGKNGSARGKRGAGTAETAPVRERLPRRGRREHSATPAPTPVPSNGHNGAERDLSMLGGVIIQELIMERDAITQAISVIERRFVGVKVG